MSLEEDEELYPFNSGVHELSYRVLISSSRLIFQLLFL